MDIQSTDGTTYCTGSGATDFQPGACVSAASPSVKHAVKQPVLACFLRKTSLEVIYAKQ
jgi:hypothetical protein